MYTKSPLFVTLALAVSMVIIHPGIVRAQTSDVDNTKINERDRTPGELTADNQGQSSSDLKMTQDIRKAVLDDKSLSMNAHNVKIITQDGHVTLKGPVASEQEKNTISEIASRVAGPDKIHNELDVADESNGTSQTDQANEFNQMNETNQMNEVNQNDQTNQMNMTNEINQYNQ